MRVLVFCRSCDLGARADDFPERLVCECGESCELDFSAAIREGREVDRCALCGYSELHQRADFPRRLGLAIVAIAFIGALWIQGPYFFLPLLAASLIDLALYQVLPPKVVCYLCSAEYRGVAPRPDQGAYDLEEATRCSRLRWPRLATRPGAAEVEGDSADAAPTA
jgi:hypothetical protein